LQRYYFNTPRLGIFKPYADLFYAPSTKAQGAWVKKIQNTIEEYLSPIAFAYWFINDGDQKWKGRSTAVRISTNSFTKQECCLLENALISRYNVKVTVQKADIPKLNIQQYCLYICSKSFTTLKNIGTPVPSMAYKMPSE